MTRINRQLTNPNEEASGRWPGPKSRESKRLSADRHDTWEQPHWHRPLARNTDELRLDQPERSGSHRGTARPLLDSTSRPTSGWKCRAVSGRRRNLSAEDCCCEPRQASPPPSSTQRLRPVFSAWAGNSPSAPRTAPRRTAPAWLGKSRVLRESQLELRAAVRSCPHLDRAAAVFHHLAA